MTRSENVILLFFFVLIVLIIILLVSLGLTVNTDSWTQVGDQCYIHNVHNKRMFGPDSSTSRLYCLSNVRRSQ